MTNNIFALTCELGAALGWENISMQPGCKEHAIDDHWWFAINPHNAPTRCNRGHLVPPQSIYYEFNGWPAGSLNSGGGMIAAGAIANQDTLRAALNQAIEKTGVARWQAGQSI